MLLSKAFQRVLFLCNCCKLKINFIHDLIVGGSAEFDYQHWQGDQIEEYPVGQIYQQGNGVYFTAETFASNSL